MLHCYIWCQVCCRLCQQMLYFQWSIIRINFKILATMMLLKTSHPKSHQQPIDFKAYPHDVYLCLVPLIKLYLGKTAALRHDVNSMFFISYAPPHKLVSSRTLARWVSDILQKAGIHTKTFKTHSLHSASTSNAFSGGLSYRNCKGSWIGKCKDVWQIL